MATRSERSRPLPCAEVVFSRISNRVGLGQRVAVTTNMAAVHLLSGVLQHVLTCQMKPTSGMCSRRCAGVPSTGGFQVLYRQGTRSLAHKRSDLEHRILPLVSASPGCIPGRGGSVTLTFEGSNQVEHWLPADSAGQFCLTEE